MTLPWLRRKPRGGSLEALDAASPVPLPGPWPAGIALAMHSLEDHEGLSVVGELFDRFKYGGERRLARPLAGALAAATVSRGAIHCASHEGVMNHAPTNSFLGIDVVVHVPATTPRRFEPSRDLAYAVARALRARCLPGFIARTRALAHQKDLISWVEKCENVRGAFRVRRPEFVRGRKLLLLDDVYDSGATLEEVWRALMQAGAREVVVATITKTRYRREM